LVLGLPSVSELLLDSLPGTVQAEAGVGHWVRMGEPVAFDLSFAFPLEPRLAVLLGQELGALVGQVVEVGLVGLRIVPSFLPGSLGRVGQGGKLTCIPKQLLVSFSRFEASESLEGRFLLLLHPEASQLSLGVGPGAVQAPAGGGDGVGLGHSFAPVALSLPGEAVLTIEDLEELSLSLGEAFEGVLVVPDLPCGFLPTSAEATELSGVVAEGLGRPGR
jgi:hypothetical protein